ncbi:MAG: MmgE/PrpD family protein [Pseudomonadota bacterium]
MSRTTEHGMASEQCVVERLAEFVQSHNSRKTPDPVIAEAKRCILDTAGVTVAGQMSDVASATHDYAIAHHGSGKSRVIGKRTTCSPVAAALVNGTAAHAYDFDDTSYTGIMHGSAVVLPAALALAEHHGVRGEVLLDAFIAGVEIEYALAELFTHHVYFKGWWTTGVYGTIGAAAACAKVCDLNTEQTENAVAMASVMTTGMKASFGTDSKPLGVGMAASRGIECALLAARGLTGPNRAMEDDRGLFKLLNDDQQHTDCKLHLGERWRLIDPGILFKAYPVCSAAQAGAELTATLIRRHNINAETIAQVICDVPKLVAISLVYEHPASVREAQFSMQFAVACAAIHGTIGLPHLQQSTLDDPHVRQLMQRIQMQVPDSLLNDPTVPSRCPEGAGVTIKTTDGNQYSDFLERPTGMPGNPVSTEALTDKFANCLAHAGVENHAASELSERLLGLDTQPNCADLFDLLKS